jgi:hypothetical protein
MPPAYSHLRVRSAIRIGGLRWQTGRLWVPIQAREASGTKQAGVGPQRGVAAAALGEIRSLEGQASLERDVGAGGSYEQWKVETAGGVIQIQGFGKGCTREAFPISALAGSSAMPQPVTALASLSATIAGQQK